MVIRAAATANPGEPTSLCFAGSRCNVMLVNWRTGAMAREFDWSKSASYDSERKEAFHREAKKQLKTLAQELGFASGSYDLRTNMGGIAVSGEVTLHHNDLYVQASQSLMGNDKGILIRTCESRKDFTGGRNHFAPLSWLNDGERPKLVKFCAQVLEQKLGFDADAKDDPSYNPHYSTPRFAR